MNKSDMQKLFALIETLYPASKRKPKTTVDEEAWFLVLKPWSYEEVKDAVIARTRKNRFAPDVSELVPYLPKLEVVSDEQALQEPSPAQLEKFDRQYAALQEKYRTLNLPSPAQAKKQGMTYAAWCTLEEMAVVQGVKQ